MALAVALLTVAAFWARHSDGLVFLPHPDERVYETQMKLMRAEEPRPELVQNYRYYPLPIARLALILAPEAPAPATVEEHVREAGRDLSSARRLIAALAALGIPLAYCLARRFFTPWWSFAAAALYAASPLAIAFAHQARPHAAVVTPMLAALIAFVMVAERPRLRNYLLAAVAIGSALAILQNGVALIPAFLAAHLLRDRARACRAWLGLGIAAIVVAAMVFLSYPAGANLDTESGGQVVRLSGHQVFLDQFRGRGFARLWSALADYEPWLILFAVPGAVLAISPVLRGWSASALRQRSPTAIVATFFLAYLVVVGIYDGSRERFLLPLMPLVAFLAVHAASSAAHRLAQRWDHVALWTTGLVLLMLVPQSLLAVRLARAYRAPSTLVQAAAWIREHIPPGSARVAIIFQIDLPLMRTRSALQETRRQTLDPTRPWLVYQGRLQADVLAEERYDLISVPSGTPNLEEFKKDIPATIASWKADYVVVQARTVLSWYQLDDMREHLLRTTERVARFSPYSDPHLDRPFWYQHDPYRYGWWTAHLMSAESTGPVVEIYSLRP